MKKLTSFLTCFLMIVPCGAGIITVDDNGPADFNNIQAAIDAANSGETIVVQPGLYNGHINFLGKNIILTSTNSADFNTIKSTSIGSAYPNEASITFNGIEDPNCRLVGFNINGFVDGLDWLAEPLSPHPTHATISNCLFQGNSGRGGTVISSFDGTISNCIITDNLNQSSILAYSPAIEDCYGLIKNCTIANNWSQGISLVNVSNDGNLVVENCIIYNNLDQIDISTEATITILYSNIQDGANGIWILDSGTIDWGPGNIDVDPYFTREGLWGDNGFFEGDYRLLPESLCIDAGDPNYIAEPNETDLGGNPRIINGRIDIGAYEFQPSGPAELLLDIADYIDELSLHKGIANSLQSKLDNALEKLEDDNKNNDMAAINSLQAFINTVAVQSDKKISQADADALIAATREIIELFGEE